MEAVREIDEKENTARDEEGDDELGFESRGKSE